VAVIYVVGEMLKSSYSVLERVYTEPEKVKAREQKRLERRSKN